MQPNFDQSLELETMVGCPVLATIISAKKTEEASIGNIGVLNNRANKDGGLHHNDDEDDVGSGSPLTCDSPNTESEVIVIDPFHNIDTSRGHWNNRAEFLLSIIGAAVGLGNFWRFPYLAYENGGAAFLIPYLLALGLIVRPLFLCEMALGQYTQLGPLHVWARCIPAMAGLGVTMSVGTVLYCVLFTIIPAYTVYFSYAVLASISSGKVPWSWCNPEWAGPNCQSLENTQQHAATNLSASINETNSTSGSTTSSLLFWRNAVLGLDPTGLGDFGNLGEVQWHLVLSLLFVWVIICLSTIKGIKSIGKVVYFTATFPFLVLLILMVASVLLPGADKGLKFLFIPRWERLLELKVWRLATEQAIYSMNVVGGSVIAMGSYNKFNAKIHVDVLILSVVDLIASLLCAITVFSVLGAMALEMGVEDITTVMAPGPGLAFITFPEAIYRTMALPHLMSFLFFCMLFTLGIDTLFSLVEVLTTTTTDLYHRLRLYRPAIVIAWCVTLFGFGVTSCTAKAQYLLYLLDVMGTGFGSLLQCLLKSVTVHWLYGVQRFSKDLKFMVGYSPSVVMRACWAVITPITLMILLASSIAEWQNPAYAGTLRSPDWAVALGFSVVFLPLAAVPIMFAVHVIQAALRKDVTAAFRPSPLWRAGCPPTSPSQVL